MTQLSATHVRVGDKRFPFIGIEETAETYLATIDRLGLGGSQTPHCDIMDGENVVAHVSYNGRVWLGDRFDWLRDPGRKDVQPIYRPKYERNRIIHIN